MVNNLITHLQLFAIGFSFGVAGPCLLICTPIVAAYIGARNRAWPDTFSGIFTFMSGRLVSYLLLGFLAGLSGSILRQFNASSATLFFRPLAGVVSIAFAVIIITQKNSSACQAMEGRSGRFGRGGLFLFGLSIGMAPCAPLLAILFDIALISRNPVDSLSYAFSFGMGVFLSGALAISIFTGLVKSIPQKFLKSRASNMIFKLACAGLLVTLGVGLIIQ